MHIIKEETTDEDIGSGIRIMPLAGQALTKIRLLRTGKGGEHKGGKQGHKGQGMQFYIAEHIFSC